MNMFYIFQDPFGLNDCKVGITGHPDVRLGTYQNAYSSRSHVACFDYVFCGSRRAIENLEKAVKQELDWDIELDGRGHTEWVSNHTSAQALDKVLGIIEGFRFKVWAVDKKYLPLTVESYQALLEDTQND